MIVFFGVGVVFIVYGIGLRRRFGWIPSMSSEIKYLLRKVSSSTISLTKSDELLTNRELIIEYLCDIETMSLNSCDYRQQELHCYQLLHSQLALEC